LRSLDTLQPLGTLVLRLVLGAVMVAHGYPKVFGGISHHVESVAHIGLPGWLAYFSAAAEFVGGLLLIIGLFSRLAALAVGVNMLVAVFGVHWRNGFLGQGNYQFPLALAAIAFALIFSGAGPISLDYAVRAKAGGKKGGKTK
jgi:putative oxidoreductase